MVGQEKRRDLGVSLSANMFRLDKVTKALSSGWFTPHCGSFLSFFLEDLDEDILPFAKASFLF